jgi:hypothetical protein
MKILKIFYLNCRQLCGYFFCTFVCLLSHKISTAQVVAKQNQSKLSPTLQQKLFSLSLTGKSVFTIHVSNLAEGKQLLEAAGAKIIYTYSPANIITAEFSNTQLNTIVSKAGVLFIDTKQIPAEELIFGFIDFGTNKVTTVFNLFPDKNGKNLAVSIKENKFDTADIDFKGRINTTNLASSVVSAHASVMATMVAGGGNSWNNTKGAAWQSTISSASFQNLLPELPVYYTQNNISVQNHSYGTIIENFYGAEASGYDASVVTNQSLLHVFSAGNSGTITPSTGNYAGIAGSSNLTGNFKQAKNIITVGHADSFYRVLPPSSKGPAYDGRVKPELVAFGEDGSSGAAAIVSGIALTLQQAYKDANSGNLPPASLIKTILLNTADDTGNPGIDYISGYGIVNAYKAMQTITTAKFVNGSVTNNDTQVIPLTIPANTRRLKITLVWTDPQATPNAPRSLVNDLDLELFQPSTNTKWLPWVLSSYPNSDSLQKLPERKRDALNNVEQIILDNPVAGSYQIFIKGFNVTTTAQNFSVAWQIDTLDTFQWYHPGKNDHFTSGTSNVIRWQSNYAATAGTLEYSTDNGNNWQTISTNVNLQNGVYQFNPPAIYSKALLRMRFGANSFVTDTFTFSKLISTAVAFNCADSFSITWPKVNGISNYRVYRMGNQYLESFATTTDTSLQIAKNGNTNLFYSIEPVLSNKPAVRSYTFNYELQGVGCYVSNLLADLTASNEGLLNLEMGTVFNVKSISFEKFTTTGFTLLEKKTIISGLNYSSLDTKIKPGASHYRVAVELNNGRIVYSPHVQLLFVGASPAVVYPNPVQRNGVITVLSKLEDQLQMQLIGNDGRIVLQQQLKAFPEQISVKGLPKGVYYYRFLKAGEKVQSGTLIVN